MPIKLYIKLKVFMGSIAVFDKPIQELSAVLVSSTCRLNNIFRSQCY